MRQKMKRQLKFGNFLPLNERNSQWSSLLTLRLMIYGSSGIWGAVVQKFEKERCRTKISKREGKHLVFLVVMDETIASRVLIDRDCC